MPTRILFPFAAIAAIAAILIACGGGGTDAGRAPLPVGPSTEAMSAACAESPGDAGSPMGSFVTGQNAACVLGRATFSDGLFETARSGLHSPTAVAVAPDGTVFIADREHHRVLGFRPSPSGIGEDVFVLGQPDLSSASLPATTSRDTLAFPASISIANGRMAIVDNGANRVLVYDTIPTSGSARPDLVLGQPNFSSAGSSCTAGGLKVPSAVVLTPAGQVLVADRWNHRVVVWNAVPTDSGQPADLVLGQASLGECVEPTAATGTAFKPDGVWSDGERIVVLCADEHRALVWSTFPLTDNKEATFVLGQFDVDGYTASNDDDHDHGPEERPSARTLSMPWQGVVSDGTRLFISDSMNSRVLVWNSFPQTSFAPATGALGQVALDRGAANDLDGDGPAVPAINARTLAVPSGLAISGNRLFVTDSGNHRVVVHVSR